MSACAGDAPLPVYLGRLLATVCDRTGRRLVIRAEEGIGYDSELRIARSSSGEHVLAYVPAYAAYWEHFLVSAACKLLRLCDVPAAERLMPARELGRRLPLHEDRELRRKLHGLDRAHLDSLSSFLYRGTVRQLTSMPLDLRVERDIASTLAEHRERQGAYLRRQVEDLEPHFLPEIATICPTHVYAASTTMNLVLADEAADLAGVEPGPLFQSSVHRPLAARLHEILRATAVPGYAGDRIVTDAWAHELGLDGWYEWVPFEATF